MRLFRKAVLTLVCIPTCAFTSVQLHYSVQPLGDVNGIPLIGLRINDSGHIAATTFADTEIGYVWFRGVAKPLINADQSFTVARAINNGDVVIGNWVGLDDTDGGGGRWDVKGAFEELGDVYTALPQDINDNGQVVGYEHTDAQDAIFYWSDKTGALNLGTGRAFAINDSGEIVGTTVGLIHNHGFVMRGTAIDAIEVPGWATSAGKDINNRGDVAVNLSDESKQPRGAIVSRNGIVKLLPLLPNTVSSRINAMNGRGDAIGVVADQDGNETGVVWPASGGVVSLDAVSTPPVGWSFRNPRSINSRGQIVVTAFDIDQNQTSYLLTPGN